MSRTPSAGFPATDCHEGFGIACTASPHNSVVAGAPVAHPLGPPLPAAVVKKLAPLELLQSPEEPELLSKFRKLAISPLAQESSHGISGM